MAGVPCSCSAGRGWKWAPPASIPFFALRNEGSEKYRCEVSCRDTRQREVDTCMCRQALLEVNTCSQNSFPCSCTLRFFLSFLLPFLSSHVDFQWAKVSFSFFPQFCSSQHSLSPMSNYCLHPFFSCFRILRAAAGPPQVPPQGRAARQGGWARQLQTLQNLCQISPSTPYRCVAPD